MITDQWLSQQLPGLSSITKLPDGGQKWVFGATHVRDGDVVIKLIKPTTEMERVKREILAVSQISSTRVPKILEVGVINSVPWGGDLIWLREQRINGEDVHQIIARSALDKDEVLLLGLHMLEALSDANHARIVHRDVKPKNIMRCNSGSYWLLDFGIARHLDLSSLTPTVAFGGAGTVGYAPPEQFRNRKDDIDSRADLFALAVTLVECLSGQNPYLNGARDVPEVLRRIEQAPLAVPTVPWDSQGIFADLINAMGQCRVDCRPQDVSEAIAWMREIIVAYGPS